MKNKKKYSICPQIFENYLMVIWTFYVLFNSISVMPGQWEGNDEEMPFTVQNDSLDSVNFEPVAQRSKCSGSANRWGTSLGAVV